MNIRHQIALIMVPVVICSGCATYKREPLNPAAIQQQVRQFSLTDMASEYSRARPAEPLSEVSAGLSADEIGAFAMVLNPALKAKRLALGIACGQLVTSGLYPNPALDTRSLITSAKPSGRKLIEGSLSFEVLRWHEIAAEKEAKKANVCAVRYEILTEEWKTVSDARAAYWTVVAARERLRLNKEEMDLSQRLLSSVKSRIKNGAGTALDLNLAELQHLKLQAETQKLEADTASAERALRLAVGAPYDAEIKLRIPGNPLALATCGWSGEELQASLIDSATMKALEWRYSVAEGDLRAAIARQYPGLRLGPSTEFDFGGNIWSSLTGFVASADLPLLSRNQGEIKEKSAARDVARAEYVAKLQSSQAALADAAAQAENIQMRLAIQEKELMPKADENIRLMEKSYEVGDVSGYELLTARSMVIEVRKSHLDLLIEYRTALQATEAALGRRLDDLAKTGTNR